MPMIAPRDGGNACAVAPLVDLVDHLEADIARRTGRQVRDLRVLAIDGRLILRGRSRTYHVKQLAQEAALDGAGGWLVLINEIEVC